MAKKKEDAIRVHNQGKRTIDYYPDEEAKKKRKPKYINPGRAVEMPESVAKKYIKAYPRDLVEFDSLVSGEKKNLSKENAQLESLNQTLHEENERLQQDKQELNDKISELEKELEEATKPDDKALKDSEQNLKDKTADKG